jgi:uncharacterized membrane protein
MTIERPLSVAILVATAALLIGVGALVLGRGVARKRPVLTTAMVLATLPVLWVGATWADLLTGDRLRFERPWATLLGFAAMAFVALRLGRHRGTGSPWRTALTDLYVATATLAAAMAVGGPELGKPLDKLTVVLGVDRSRSIDLVPHAAERIGREVAVAELSMRADDRIATLAFAAEPAVEDPLRPRSELPAPQAAAIGRDGTDLAAAIRRALAEVPPDSAARVVLLSDGVATRGDTLAAAAAAVAAGVPIDIVPLEQRSVPDVRVVALRAPARADEGEAMDMRLVTSSPAAADIEVRIHRDGELVSRARASIAKGEDVLRIREHAPSPGLHRYDVAITALDPALDEAPEDNSASAFVRVRGPATALVLEGDAGQGAFVASALEAGAFRVDQGSTTSVPADLGELAGYDLVVLSDVRAADLSIGQVDAIARYVRDLGGGLILLGGDRGMGPGGYAKTPIEEISPVSFDLKQDKRRASIAEVIGIDISGSMGMTVGGHTKLELANEAAARSAALLGTGDMLGVAHVDTTVTWSVPLAAVVDKAAIEKAIRSVGVGGGGIYVDITLAAAYRALDAEHVNLKHVLLFADGSDAEQMAGCRAQVGDAYRRGITTSVVALGKGGDVPELEQLSRLGHGRFYLVEDATRLPAVFSQETILAARSALVEIPFRVGMGVPASITSGIAFNEAPPLGGYVVTIPKGRASVHLSGPEGDPILATWSAGVGRAAAFTSDLKGRWGKQWTSWPGAARLVAQMARDVARRAEDEKVRLEADTSQGELHVRATVVGDDGRLQSFRRLQLHVAGPEGFSRELSLEASGAGAYVASIPLSRPGTYLGVVRDELSGEQVGTTGAVLTAGEELRPTGSDTALLERVSTLTGGQRRDTLAGLFDDRATKRFAYQAMTSTLVVLAALGLLLSVAARRLALPEAWLALPGRLRGALRRSPGAPNAAPTVAAEPTVASLLVARQRTRTTRGPPPSAAPAPLPTTATARLAPPPTRPQPAPPAAPTPPAAPVKTAAEILVERRRNR